MKKIFAVLLLMLAMGFASAQNYTIYSFLVFNGAGRTPVLISEKTLPAGDWKGFDFKSNYLRDAEGKELKFNNFLPALGYIQQLGWTVPDIEQQLKENQARVLEGRSVFLLTKEVSESEWNEWIETGKLKK